MIHSVLKGHKLIYVTKESHVVTHTLSPIESHILRISASTEILPLSSILYRSSSDTYPPHQSLDTTPSSADKGLSEISESNLSIPF